MCSDWWDDVRSANWRVLGGVAWGWVGGIGKVSFIWVDRATVYPFLRWDLRRRLFTADVHGGRLYGKRGRLAGRAGGA